MNTPAKQYYKKVAIFDLDGTLWKQNSHMAITAKYYKFSCIKKIYNKFFAYLSPNEHLMYINRLYKNIPHDFINSYNPTFRSSILELLKIKQDCGYKVLIISNAPKEIVALAAKRLEVDYLRADIGNKASALTHYCNCDTVFVCTDNRTDVDLLDIADEIVICASGRKKNFFKQRYKDAVFMEDL